MLVRQQQNTADTPRQSDRFGIASGWLLVASLLCMPLAQADAEKGISLPLYGGSSREVTYVSVRVYRWVQKDGEAYGMEPAPEVAVFPQMVRLEPQARSAVRLAWARSAPIDERYYRLVLEEFDRPGGERGGKDKAVLGFRVRPSASLPLIVYGRDGLSPAQLSAKFTTVMVDDSDFGPVQGDQAAENKKVPVQVARVTNNGETYGRVIGFRDTKGAVYNEMVYILPGSTMDISLPRNVDPAGLELLFTSGRSEHIRKPGDPARSVAIN